MERHNVQQTAGEENVTIVQYKSRVPRAISGFAYLNSDEEPERHLRLCRGKVLVVALANLAENFLFFFHVSQKKALRTERSRGKRAFMSIWCGSHQVGRRQHIRPDQRTIFGNLVFFPAAVHRLVCSRWSRASGEQVPAQLCN